MPLSRRRQRPQSVTYWLLTTEYWLLLSIPLPEPKLEVEVVAARAQRVGRALLVLRDEGEAVAHAVLDGDDLIRLARDVGRVRDRQGTVDLAGHGEARRRTLPASARNHGVELEAVQAEELVGGARDGRVNQRVGQEARRRADARLRERRGSFGAARKAPRSDERDNVGLRQRRVGGGRRRQATRKRAG